VAHTRAGGLSQHYGTPLLLELEFLRPKFKYSPSLSASQTITAESRGDSCTRLFFGFFVGFSPGMLTLLSPNQGPLPFNSVLNLVGATITVLTVSLSRSPTCQASLGLLTPHWSLKIHLGGFDRNSRHPSAVTVLPRRSQHYHTYQLSTRCSTTYCIVYGALRPRKLSAERTI